MLVFVHFLVDIIVCHTRLMLNFVVHLCNDNKKDSRSDSDSGQETQERKEGKDGNKEPVFGEDECGYKFGYLRDSKEWVIHIQSLIYHGFFESFNKKK